jgi:hypothetical protein
MTDNKKMSAQKMSLYKSERMRGAMSVGKGKEKKIKLNPNAATFVPSFAKKTSSIEAAVESQVQTSVSLNVNAPVFKPTKPSSALAATAS